MTATPTRPQRSAVPIAHTHTAGQDGCGRCEAPPATPTDYPVICQGCGAVRGGHMLGRAHNCWRNEDGTYEEGGTFQ